MGPIGANGMALPRNFEYPVASFDEDLSEWEGKSASCHVGRAGFLLTVVLVVVKLGGKLWSHKQQHTPFDVVAWHGKYAFLFPA